MVLRKKIFLLLSLLLITGCSSKYQLEITNDKFIENVNTVILNEDIPESNPVATISDNYTPFIKMDNFVTPFISSQKILYNKTVDETNAGYNVNLNYTYTPEEFKDSYALNMCFENYVFQNNKKNFIFHLNGTFYCLYGDKTTIEVKTDNYVSEHNADKVEDNKYIWYITKDEIKTKDISIKISKEKKDNYVFRNTMIIITCGVLIVGAILITYKKIKGTR